MLGLKLLFLLLLVFLALALVRGLRDAMRFRRRLDDSTAETAQRLREHVESRSQPSQNHGEIRRVTPEVSPDEVRAAERELLRHLCTAALTGPEGEEAIRFLGTYPFQDVIHEQVFHALRELGIGRPGLVREQLPARLTQKGFPDIDFESFLVPPSAAGVSVEELVEPLRRRAGHR